jgi:hypothetical protein
MPKAGPGAEACIYHTGMDDISQTPPLQAHKLARPTTFQTLGRAEVGSSPTLLFVQKAAMQCCSKLSVTKDCGTETAEVD